MLFVNGGADGGIGDDSRQLYWKIGGIGKTAVLGMSEGAVLRVEANSISKHKHSLNVITPATRLEGVRPVLIPSLQHCITRRYS